MSQDRATEDRDEKAANLFDLRRIIGGLLIVYGIILVIAGVTDSAEEVRQAAGIRINLWAGIGMLVVGALFWAWALWRPLGEQLEPDDSD